jgi:DNA-binding transcriptional ArsR family regulator
MSKRASAAVEVLRAPERAAALLDPVRLQIVRELAEPDSASGLARRLGVPRQRLNYHLRELERHGLVELVEERKKGNCLERIVRATARSYVVGPDALGGIGADPERVVDRFSAAYLVALASRSIREVALLRARAEKAGKKLATFSLHADVRFASAEARTAFTEELATAVAKLVAKHHDERAEGGRLFRFTIAAHPALTEPAADEDLPPSRLE